MNKARAKKIARDAFGRTASCRIVLVDGKIPPQGSQRAAGKYRIEYSVPAEDPQRNGWRDWPKGTGHWSNTVLLGYGDSWESALSLALSFVIARSIRITRPRRGSPRRIVQRGELGAIRLTGRTTPCNSFFQ